VTTLVNYSRAIIFDAIVAVFTAAKDLFFQNTISEKVLFR